MSRTEIIYGSVLVSQQLHLKFKIQKARYFVINIADFIVSFFLIACYTRKSLEGKNQSKKN